MQIKSGFGFINVKNIYISTKYNRHYWKQHDHSNPNMNPKPEARPVLPDLIVLSVATLPLFFVLVCALDVTDPCPCPCSRPNTVETVPWAPTAIPVSPTPSSASPPLPPPGPPPELYVICYV